MFNANDFWDERIYYKEKKSWHHQYDDEIGIESLILVNLKIKGLIYLLKDPCNDIHQILDYWRSISTDSCLFFCRAESMNLLPRLLTMGEILQRGIIQLMLVTLVGNG